jgi:methylthioribulose-1-phosphate dehydratase
MGKQDNNRKDFAKWIRSANKKGWSPGTSTNYSFIENPEKNTIVISKSGIDKSYFEASDFMEIDRKGNPTEEYKDISSSAETKIHCELYDLFPSTKYILHSHSKASTLISHLKKADKKITFSGYEVLKGLPPITTHESTVDLPIFENSQNMDAFRLVIRNNQKSLAINGFLMEKHGLYTWGDSFLAAKKHLEILEFLLDCELTLLLKK